MKIKWIQFHSAWHNIGEKTVHDRNICHCVDYHTETCTPEVQPECAQRGVDCAAALTCFLSLTRRNPAQNTDTRTTRSSAGVELCRRRSQHEEPGADWSIVSRQVLHKVRLVYCTGSTGRLETEGRTNHVGGPVALKLQHFIQGLIDFISQQTRGKTLCQKQYWLTVFLTFTIFIVCILKEYTIDKWFKNVHVYAITVHKDNCVVTRLHSSCTNKTLYLNRKH